MITTSLSIFICSILQDIIFQFQDTVAIMKSINSFIAYWISCLSKSHHKEDGGILPLSNSCHITYRILCPPLQSRHLPKRAEKLFHSTNPQLPVLQSRIEKLSTIAFFLKIRKKLYFFILLKMSVL